MTLWLIRAGSRGEHEQKFLDEGKVYVAWDGLNVDLKVTWTPKPEPMLMRASPPARLGKEKPHESQTPQPRADHPQVAHR